MSSPARPAGALAEGPHPRALTDRIGALPLVVAIGALFVASVLRGGLPPPQAPPAGAPPSAAALRILSLGHPTAAATVAWIDVVRRFTRAQDSPTGDATWLPGALEPIGELDPRWETPWVYGALMARFLGDVPTHQAVLTRALDLHPAQPWFPYALGMSWYMDLGDPARAADWLERAAALPGAPTVHGEAARAFRELP